MDKIDLVKIIQNGGATLNESGRAVSFRRGYQVSKKDCYILNTRHTNKILKAVNGILNSLKPGEFCGVWVDGGRVYVDISERIPPQARRPENRTGTGANINLRLERGGLHLLLNYRTDKKRVSPDPSTGQAARR